MQTLSPEPTIMVDENRERERDREGGNKMWENQGEDLMQPLDDCDHPHNQVQTDLESDKWKDKFGSIDHSYNMPHSVPVVGSLTKSEISKSRYVSSHCHATHTWLNNFAVLPTISSLSV